MWEIVASNGIIATRTLCDWWSLGMVVYSSTALLTAIGLFDTTAAVCTSGGSGADCCTKGGPPPTLRDRNGAEPNAAVTDLC